jgi:hypothetical protein
VSVGDVLNLFEEEDDYYEEDASREVLEGAGGSIDRRCFAKKDGSSAHNLSMD